MEKEWQVDSGVSEEPYPAVIGWVLDDCDDDDCEDGAGVELLVAALLGEEVESLNVCLDFDGTFSASS